MRKWWILVGLAAAGCTTLQPGPDRLYDALADTDVALAAAAMQSALESRRDGELVRWINAATGSHGAITPQRTFVTDRGVFCRVYLEELTVGDENGVVENTACRNDDGGWTWVG